MSLFQQDSDIVPPSDHEDGAAPSFRRKISILSSTKSSRGKRKQSTPHKSPLKAKTSIRQDNGDSESDIDMEEIKRNARLDEDADVRGRREMLDNPSGDNNTDFDDSSIDIQNGNAHNSSTDSGTFGHNSSFQRLRSTTSTTVHSNNDFDVAAILNRQRLLEQELRELKSKLNAKKQRIQVSKATRGYVRNSYANLDKVFNFNKSPYDPANEEVLLELKEKVVGLDSTIQDPELNQAIKDYFLSKKYYKRKANEKTRADARQHQRKVTKMNKRKNALKRRKMSDSAKTKAKEVLTVEYMSSEEERDDCFEVRPLRWRSNACDELFDELDKTARSLMTPQARRQTAKRQMGPYSSRAAPKCTPSTMWAIR